MSITFVTAVQTGQARLVQASTTMGILVVVRLVMVNPKQLLCTPMLMPFETISGFHGTVVRPALEEKAPHPVVPGK